MRRYILQELLVNSFILLLVSELGNGRGSPAQESSQRWKYRFLLTLQKAWSP